MKALFFLFLLTPVLAIGQLNQNFFKKIQSEKIQSDQNIEWKNFGPGMSGYNEEFWCHPTDENVMFMGPEVKGGYWNAIPQLTAAEMIGIHLLQKNIGIINKEIPF